MTEHDERLSRSYRELSREEPPAALDAAIVASARRAVRPRRSRWAGPLSIAAVLVLALGVTLRMQHEEPGIETSPPPRQPSDTSAREAPAPPTAADAPATAPVTVAPPVVERRAQTPQKRAASPKPKRAPAMQQQQAPSAAKDLAPPAMNAFPAPATRAAPEASAGAPTSEMPAAPAFAPMQKRALDAQQPASPEAQLERIAALRESGRHAEADRALEAFRRRYPDYRIPDAVWARVKPE